MQWYNFLFFTAFLLAAFLIFLLIFRKNSNSFSMAPSDVVGLIPKSSQEIDSRLEAVINKSRLSIDSILALKDSECSFENAARAFDDIGDSISLEGSLFGLVMLTSSDAELRNKAKEAGEKLSKFVIDEFANNKRLYKVFKSYSEEIAPTEKLNPEQTYFIEENLKAFKRAGLELPDDELEEVKNLEKKMVELGQSFEKAINDDDRYILVSKIDLKGLKDEFVDSLPQETKNGQTFYKLDTSYPVVNQVMQNCSIESTRKALWKEFNNRAFPQNLYTLKELIKLRDELSKKLGYKNYADFSISDEMAGSVKKVEEFLQELFQKSVPKSEKELERYLKELPEGVSLSEDGKIFPWSWSFIKERYKEKNFNLDQRKIAEFFPVEHVLRSLYEVLSEFFPITFREEKVDGLWHKDVKLIGVYRDGAGPSKRKGLFDSLLGFFSGAPQKELMGYLLVDLFPRKGKYTHACQTTIKDSFVSSDGNKRSPSIVALIANFPKPTANGPSLLLHNDVETLFHEFGHALHSLLSATQMKSFAGTSVDTDFVEVPSQMLQEWVWDKEVLNRITKHYKTGKPIPTELADKMIKLKNFDKGDFVRRQMILSKVSLEYFKEGEKDLKKVMQKLFTRLRPYIKEVEDDNFYCSFGHLVGYNAKYYSYLWSEVYSIDIFEHIKKRGLFNRDIGQEYVEKILSKGGSVPADKLLKNFLGREPISDPFFKRLEE